MEKLKKYIKYIKYAIFPLIFIYLELIYKISVKSPFSLDFIYACISAITLGVIVNLLSSLTKKSVINKIIGFGITSIVCIIFCVQIVYRDTFTSPFSVSIAFGGAEGVNAITEFADILMILLFSAGFMKRYLWEVNRIESIGYRRSRICGELSHRKT